VKGANRVKNSSFLWTQKLPHSLHRSFLATTFLKALKGLEFLHTEWTEHWKLNFIYNPLKNEIMSLCPEAIKILLVGEANSGA